MRKIFDKLAPLFHKGGKFETLFPVYEMFETFFYGVAEKATSAAHIRDAADSKRVMILVVLFATPALLFGVYNVGYQALADINNGFASLPTGFQIQMLTSIMGANLSQTSIVDCLAYGLAYFLPLYIVVSVVGIGLEVVFSIVRKHEVNEGAIVSTFLYVCVLPPTIPLWQAAMGIAFGLVVGKEIFGGTGKNFLNPALVGRVFLYFAYPAQISGGDDVWVAAQTLSIAGDSSLDNYDAMTGATLLSYLNTYGMMVEKNPQIFINALIGYKSGSIGEVSIVLIVLGGLGLLMTKIASWRIVLSGILGLILTAMLFNAIGSETNKMFQVPWYWHFVSGGFAFGIFFMATDPVSASMTNAGRYVYGFLIGFMTILIRVLNPAYPEGIMLAILFGNVFAPTIDAVVVMIHNKARLKRYEAISKKV